MTNGEFEDGLKQAMAKHGIWAGEGKTGDYSVDANVDVDLPITVETWSPLTATLKATYRISTVPDHTIVWEKTIETSDTLPALLDGNVVKNILLVNPVHMYERTRKASQNAAQENIKAFLKAFDEWSTQQCPLPS